MLQVIDGFDMSSLSKESSDAIVKLRSFASQIDDDDLADVDIMFRDATANMIRKLTKDFDIMLNVEKPDDYVLPMTNRSNVSDLRYSALIFFRNDRLPTSSSSTER